MPAVEAPPGIVPGLSNRFATASLAGGMGLGFESDLLSDAPGWVRYAGDLAGQRNPVRGPMSRIYAVEACQACSARSPTSP